MNRSKILWLVGLLTISGCSTTPAPNPWLDIERDELAPAERPISLPSFPIPQTSSELACYDRAGVVALDVYRETARANTELSRSHAAQIDELASANDHLIDAGIHQRRIADYRLELLEEERRHMFFERIGYWAVILGAVAVATK